MINVSYDFYKEVYKGNIVSDENDFDRLILKAEQYVELYTMNRAGKVDESVADVTLCKDLRFCLCEITDGLSSLENDGGRILSSRSASKVSESYQVSNSSNTFSLIARNTVELYLSKYNMSCRWI